MRPRISQQEAAYLVEVLTAQHEEMKQKYCNVEQLEKDYTRIIHDLKHPVQVEYTDKGYFAGHRLIGTQEALSLVRLAKALKEEHPNLLAEKWQLWDCLRCHEVLLKKYTAIANGEPHDGRYKRLSVASCMFPKKDQVLEVLT